MFLLQNMRILWSPDIKGSNEYPRFLRRISGIFSAYAGRIHKNLCTLLHCRNFLFIGTACAGLVEGRQKTGKSIDPQCHLNNLKAAWPLQKTVLMFGYLFKNRLKLLTLTSRKLESSDPDLLQESITSHRAILCLRTILFLSAYFSTLLYLRSRDMIPQN